MVNSDLIKYFSLVNEDLFHWSIRTLSVINSDLFHWSIRTLPVVNSENFYWSVWTLLVVDSINQVKPNQSLWKIFPWNNNEKQRRNYLKKQTNNTFISISIFFKVFKNLCLNENDETLFLKKCISIILVKARLYIKERHTGIAAKMLPTTTRYAAHCLAAALYDVFTVEASIHPRQLKHLG